MDGREMTLGERRVRLAFNPSDNLLVAQIKRKTAELIDLCDKHQDDHPMLLVGSPSFEAARMWEFAIAAYEEAAMWAVKGATA